VWKVLSALPIEVYDEIDHSVWDNELWELVIPRSDGDYVGKRTIGSANIISAYNLLHLKLVAESDDADSFMLFRSCLEDLNSHNLIRRRPERVRQSFRTV
jgi:hypothetical protein